LGWVPSEFLTGFASRFSYLHYVSVFGKRRFRVYKYRMVDQSLTGYIQPRLPSATAPQAYRVVITATTRVLPSGLKATEVTSA
jgi:hypothetical protein